MVVGTHAVEATIGLIAIEPFGSMERGSVMRHRLWLVTLMIVTVTGLGCRQLNNWSEQRSLEQTREAEEYPYAVYPISEESKGKLCQALSLSPEDKLCQSGTEVMHWEVFERIEEEFPVGETPYSEVEAKLGSFPHVRRGPKREDGTLISLDYAYGLTEYKGACIYFHIDLDDLSTVERILASSPGRSGSGMNPTVCAPFRGSDIDSENE